jgi:hypothetical protein
MLPKAGLGLRPSESLTDVERVFGMGASSVTEETHLVYEEPALDLVTGTVIPAAQQTRHPGNDQGLATRFAGALHGGVGVFLLVRTSAVLLIRGEFTSYFPSPYVDKYGEPDIGLRRGLPLILSLQRYSRLSEIWARGAIGIQVTRDRSNAERVIRRAWY